MHDTQIPPLLSFTLNLRLEIHHNPSRMSKCHCLKSFICFNLSIIEQIYELVKINQFITPNLLILKKLVHVRLNLMKLKKKTQFIGIWYINKDKIILLYICRFTTFFIF